MRSTPESLRVPPEFPVSDAERDPAASLTLAKRHFDYRCNNIYRPERRLSSGFFENSAVLVAILESTWPVADQGIRDSGQAAESEQPPHDAARVIFSC